MSRLRTLEHHFDIAPALVQASALEAAGVPCFIANYQICSTLPFQAIALVRVDVADADLTRAREVLAELQASPPEEMSASEPTDICPKCRSMTSTMERPAPIAALEKSVFGVWLSAI